MRLVLELAALTASASIASAVDYPARPKCTPASTKQFVDALNKASNGCTASSSYQWDGNNDPTSAQRREICECTVAPFQAPECSWIKSDVYNVSVNEHFHYVYNCIAINGKQAPKVTEVPVGNGTAAPSPPVAECSSSQTSAFTAALKKASPCLAAASYEWGGPKDPTEAELADLCKCNPVGDVTLPSCSLTKESTTVSLSEHYNWIMKTKCAKDSTHIGPYPKCTAAGTKQFIDSLSAASKGCTDNSSYLWEGNEDPTSAQRQEICECDIESFKLPTCSWIKADIYNVSVNEHFHYVYNCKGISGKATPNVSEVPVETQSVASSSNTPGAAPTSPKTSSDASVICSTIAGVAVVALSIGLVL